MPKKKSFLNPDLELAHNFVSQTSRHIFLTGKAGTGKTTFLFDLQEQGIKRMITVAPTGVAAINARGTTIHSFFQMPFGPIIPEISGYTTRYESQGYARKFSKEKINIIRSIDLLIIDEISMVRADLLDGIDRILRKYRDHSKVFGGVQVLMVGDLQQLSPVVKEEEWNLLKNYYQTPYFFGSLAFRQTNFVGIVLQHVYRQKDQQFIEILNKVRNNIVDETTLSQLNQRYLPGFIDEPEQGYIILTTHNARARQINENRLSTLKGKSQKRSGNVEGDFPEYAYPTDLHLELKTGAQVMFVKNDPNPEKAYFNGKIGIIEEIEEESIRIRCQDEEPIYVTPLEWKNTKYSLDEATKEIREVVTGLFTQYPLKLAWAITIHKSQGLSFDRAIIDAAEAFAHGQVYVALSRCRSLEGLVLNAPLRSNCFILDGNISTFTEAVEENVPDEKTLFQSKKIFQADLLKELFNFSALGHNMNALLKNLDIYKATIQGIEADLIHKLRGYYNAEIKAISEKFLIQLNSLLQRVDKIEDDPFIQERIVKASTFFAPKLERFIKIFEEITPVSDNEEVKKAIREDIENLYQKTWKKIKRLEACKNGFNALSFLKIKSESELGHPPLRRRVPVKAYPKTKNTPLYNALIQWRNHKSKKSGLPAYKVLQLKTITNLCNFQPTDIKSLKKINGIGKQRIEKYGDEILQIIAPLLDGKSVPPGHRAPQQENTSRPDS